MNTSYGKQNHEKADLNILYRGCPIVFPPKKSLNKSSIYVDMKQLLSRYCSKGATYFQRIIQNDTSMYIHHCANAF